MSYNLGDNLNYQRSVTLNLNSVEGLKKQITEDGYLVHYDVPIARTGDFTYKAFEFAFVDNDLVNPMDDIKVYRDDSSFTQEVLNKTPDIPFTNDHPNGPVNVGNASSTVVGWVRDLYMKGDTLYAGRIIVHDKDTINAIEQQGKKEVSIGFEASYKLQPENINGEYFDGREQVLRINHLSLVNAGKAGPQFKMHNKERHSMSQQETFKRTVNGVEVDVSAKEAIALSENETKQRLDSLETSLKGVSDQINALVEKLSAQNAKEMPSKEDKKEDQEAADEKSDKKDDAKEDKKDDSENKCASKNSAEKVEETHASLTNSASENMQSKYFQCNAAKVLSADNILNEEYTAVFAAFQNMYNQ